ncbi:efflux RND transporter periplasmic adaptor subunit [Williamwhitmania taraxaci]|uniref:RND family efflux transporter, MFP subunit n=1 Tax=Williamwhitmania taraxaci TaxID=1640674 RepID=A0A1G6KXE3_9BACT|nr:efflux RND transporter periplasmic adaptor subunit [Williamwhitmania taraxaci]SDC35603.1 RND family efflux transporter, MFP subunit [Williamwhitmania taraxaci]
MKKNIIYTLVALALITIVVIRLINNKHTTQNRVYHYNKEKAINVQAISLTFKKVKNDISFPGTFEPNKETRISSDIQGKINSVLVDVGSIVRKGEALIQLDNSLLKLQLQSVEIQIEGLDADVKRYTVLANADAIQGVQLEKSVLGLKSAKVQRATLMEQINKTTIVAPFGGIVTAKLTEEGSFAAPGVPLLQITDISVLKFTVNVSEQELSQFKTNQIYSLYADVYPEALLSGKVIMTGSKANMGNSYPIQFSVNNTTDLKIKSGMFGQVQLKNDNNQQHIIIPASSIVGTNIKPQVYIVKDGKAILQNIIILSRFQNMALISSGLTEGDVIITNGFINLYDGANVLISN